MMNTINMVASSKVELPLNVKEEIFMVKYHHGDIRIITPNGVIVYESSSPKEDTIIQKFKEYFAPKLPIEYSIEYSRHRPIMGYYVEGFEINPIIPSWLTSKEARLYKELIKCRGDFSISSSAYKMLRELQLSIANRYW